MSRRAVLSFAFYALLVIGCEMCHVQYGQTVAEAAMDATLMVLLLGLIHVVDYSSIFVLMIIIYEVLEMYSWEYVNGTISQTFLGAFDLGAIALAPEAFEKGVLALVVILVVGFVPRMFVQDVVVDESSWISVAGALQCAIFLGCFFAFKCSVGLTGNSILMDSHIVNEIGRIEAIEAYLHLPLEAEIRKGFKKKNLVMIIIEAFEKKTMGAWAPPGYEGTMPYMQSLVHNVTFCTNVVQPSRCEVSISGTFGAHCGFPLVYPGTNANNAPVMAGSTSRFKCIGDYLEKAGYNLSMYHTGPANFGRFGHFMVNHGIKNFYDSKKGVKSDAKLVNMSIPTLERYTKNYYETGQPYALLLFFVDTHFDSKPRCEPRKELCGGRRQFQIYDCMDQRMKQFIENDLMRVVSLNDTEVIIYGDHPAKGRMSRYLKSRGEMAYYFMNDRPKKNITKSVTLYDITPTLLESLGISYSPRFPFGGSIYDEESYDPPTPDEYAYLFNRLEVDKTFP